jgi:hypothetical protein
MAHSRQSRCEDGACNCGEVVDEMTFKQHEARAIETKMTSNPITRQRRQIPDDGDEIKQAGLEPELMTALHGAIKRHGSKRVRDHLEALAAREVMPGSPNREQRTSAGYRAELDGMSALLARVGAR